MEASRQRTAGVVLGVALVLGGLATGCSGRKGGSPYKSEVTYAIPDDFRLAMMRFERRLEAHDVEGVLRTFDPVAFPHFRELEKAYLAFSRRASGVVFHWRVSDVSEGSDYREYEVPWTMEFLDVLHGHKVKRRGVSLFHWSREPVPRLIGLARDRLFP